MGVKVKHISHSPFSKHLLGGGLKRANPETSSDSQEERKDESGAKAEEGNRSSLKA